MIIAGSGMSMGGRILHHERRYLPDPNSTILFIGYQVENSIGRRIRDNILPIRIFKQEVESNAHRYSIGAYSAHADQDGLVKYCAEANKSGKLKKVFVVQGEKEGTEALAKRVKEELGIEAVIPVKDQSIELE